MVGVGHGKGSSWEEERYNSDNELKDESGSVSRWKGKHGSPFLRPPVRIKTNLPRRVKQEKEISGIRAEVTVRVAPVEVSSLDIQNRSCVP